MRLTLILFLLCTFGNLKAQLQPQSINIPMRDGKNLAGDLYLPKGQESFPVILIQTPYNKNSFRQALPLGIRQDLANSPFAFVVLDWRCFFASTSACTSGTVNRGEDGYDAIEWIAEQSWSNGKVATWGPSALGNVQFWTAFEQPPHLVCAIPEVSSPQTLYHSYYPGGVLRSGQIKTLNQLYGGAFNTVVANPYYNNLWRYTENNNFFPENINIPMLMVGGWYDHNSEINLELWSLIREKSHASVRQKHKLLIGPWVHGGTGEAYVGSEIQGDLRFKNAAFKNHEYERAFLDFYLRGIDNGWESDTANLNYYHIGENKWERSSEWPAKSIEELRFFLHADYSLSVSEPDTSSVFFYSYKPEDPSPTVGGKTLTPGLDQGPKDQSILVESRTDVVPFTSGELQDDLHWHGKCSVELFVASSEKDSDFMLRLTEVNPQGESILINTAAQRMRYREGYSEDDTVFMKKGELYPVRFELDQMAYTFKKGNRIRLLVSSSNYPEYNRNMNTGGPMYPDNNPDTLVNPINARNEIAVGPDALSHLSFDVVQNSSDVHEHRVNTLKYSAIYPNPCKDFFRIRNADENRPVKLFNLEGKVLINQEMHRGLIKVSALEKGFYLVGYVSGGKAMQQKIQVH